MHKTKIHPNIFRYISTYILSCRIKEGEISISTMKKHQILGGVVTKGAVGVKNLEKVIALSFST